MVIVPDETKKIEKDECNARRNNTIQEYGMNMNIVKTNVMRIGHER